jgi:uncharacterized membrane protein YeaQ/YmgE (transglycosylase-associated protein family)
MLSFLWTIIIGFIAGVVAKLVTPGSEYEPKGFILTTVLGVVGALVATLSRPGYWMVSSWSGSRFHRCYRRCRAHPARMGIYPASRQRVISFAIAFRVFAQRGFGIACDGVMPGSRRAGVGSLCRPGGNC